MVPKRGYEDRYSDFWDPFHKPGWQCVRCDEPINGNGPLPDGDGPLPDAGPVCGPDITSALNLTLARVETLFRSWSLWFRAEQCTYGLRHFDITELYRGEVEATGCKRGECCDEAVQVDGGCYPEWAVNWSMFGVQMRLCRYDEATMLKILAGYTGALHAGLWIYRKLQRTEWECPYSVSEAIGQKMDWARAGYAFAKTGNLIRVPLQPERTAACGGCVTPYERGRPFGIEWGKFRG